MYSVSPVYIGLLVRLSRHGTAAVCTAVGSSSVSTPIASFPTSLLSTPSAPASFATTAERQVLKLKQQPGSNSSSSSSGSSWTKPLLSAAAVATAAAGAWTLWADLSVNQAQADAVAAAAAAGLSPVSLQTQGAVVSCFAGPLVVLLQGVNPTESQLQAIATTLVAESSLLNPSDLVNSLWGLAMLGAKSTPDQLQQLGGLVVSNMQQYTVYQAVVAVWSILMLCGSSSSSSNSSSGGKSAAAAVQIAAAAWQQLQQRLQATRVEEYDEATVLYLLHAAVQQAAAAAVAAQTGEVRASLQEVLQQVDTLPRRVRTKVAAAYQEYVPFQGYIESPFLTILHIVKSLPYHIKAQSAAAAAAASQPPPVAAGPHSSVFGSFTAADAAAAVAVMADSSVLGKLKRELFFTWRSDELLDRHQRNLNQVAHVLNRILMLPLKQPADVDVLLPTLKTVIFLDDDTSPLPSLSQPRSPKQQQQQQLDTSDPQLPSNPQYWATCHDTLVTLLRNRFSAPPGGFASKTTEGIRAAKERVLQQRGFKVVHVGFSDIEGCMSSSSSGAAGEGRRSRNKPADYSKLGALLRSRLQL